MLSSRLKPEFDRDIDGASESTGMARGSESGINCIDDAAAIPPGTIGSDTGGAAFILRAEARWARLAELPSEQTKRKRDV
jgi:hypothetical protein